MLAGGLQSSGRASLRPLLLLQFLLLGGFLALGVAAGASIGQEAPVTILAGMSGVAAMAVQNGLVQTSLKGAPATAVMASKLCDERAAFPLGAFNPEYGVTPAVVGRQGVSRILEPAMSGGERQALQASAEVLRKAVARIS